MTAAMSSVMTRFRFSGSVDTLGGDDGHQLFNRSAITDFTIQETARSIIERVRTSGDVALLEMARDLDRVDLETLEVPEDVISRSLSDTLRSLDTSSPCVSGPHANCASRLIAGTRSAPPGRMSIPGVSLLLIR